MALPSRDSQKNGPAARCGEAAFFAGMQGIDSKPIVIDACRE